MNTTRMSRETLLTKIAAWLQGDDRAFEEIFYHYQPRLYRYAFKFLQNKIRSEDLTTEVLVRIWQKRKDITTVATFENYLFTIARHALVDEWRKHIDTLLLTEASEQLPAAAEADLFTYKELEATYHECLSRLPEQRRRIFLMHREESFTYNEIAEKLDISPKTVENQIGATLKYLRTSLSQYLTSFLL